MKHYLKYYGLFTLVILMFTAIIGTYGVKVLRFLLIVALLTLVFLVKVNAQDKPKTPDPAKPTEINKTVELAKPAKPTFEQSLKAEDAFPFKMSGNFTYQQAQDYLFFESVGEARIAQANDVSARDYTRMKNNHQLVTDSLKAKFGHQALTYITDRLKKFTADTTAQYHPKK